MGKKTFKSGFDTLFHDALEEKSKGKPKVSQKSKKEKSLKNQKSFASDLDLFLQDAIEESIQEQVNEVKKKPSKRKSSARKKPVFGLDALIRQTVETSEIKSVVEAGEKRVTFTFDKNKVEKLKKIARQEKAYMKDIISDLVSKYIEQYESKLI